MAQKKSAIITIIVILFIVAGLAVYYYGQKDLVSFPEAEEPAEEFPEEVSSCIVLDEEYCQKGEPLYDKNNNFVGLGFNLPNETKIYSPFEGSADSAYAEIVFPNQFHEGFSIRSSETEEVIEFTVVGAVKTVIKPEMPYFPEEPERLVMEEVAKGQLVAQSDKSLGYQIVPISDEETLIIGGYDILINIWQLDNEINRMVRNKDELTKLFNYVK